MDVGITAGLAALVKKVVDFVKYALNADLNACVTQIVAWLAGVAIVMLTAASDLGNHIAVAGQNLQSLNGWLQALVGANVASLAGFGWDALKSVDSTNSAAVPDLMRNPGPPRRTAPGMTTTDSP